MDVFIYQAALLCSDCAENQKSGIVEAHRFTLSEDNMMKDDSDMWPQGPYSVDEADTPQNCDYCGTFLENSLTGDGEKYIRDAYWQFVKTGRGNAFELREWIAYYERTFSDFESITLPTMQKEKPLTISQQTRLEMLH